MGSLYIHGPGSENQRVQVHEPTSQEHGRGYIRSPDVADAQYVRENHETRRQLENNIFQYDEKNQQNGENLFQKFNGAEDDSNPEPLAWKGLCYSPDHKVR